ncbi:MAG: MTAP family purine nucleoside phosphorylase [Actinobacteria bacterium]|nr:MTAP family purine nucleoside phosphorylase [Actinomycetota bacterium]
MGRLAVVGGHSVLDVALHVALADAHRERSVPVPGGPVHLVDAGAVVFLQRHRQPGSVLAPHLDHHAHVAALAAVGCDRVLALGSCGGLRPEVGPGTTMVIDDFVALAAQPDSRFLDERANAVPGFDPGWRARVLETWNRHAATPAVDGGVYWQATGPRFETPAEIRLMAAFADLVGMTIGAECVAAAERGLAYAAVCVVDNYANGVATTRLTVEEFERGKAENVGTLIDTLRRVVPELAS